MDANVPIFSVNREEINGGKLSVYNMQWQTNIIIYRKKCTKNRIPKCE